MFVVIGENVREWSKSDTVYEKHRAHMVTHIEAHDFLVSGPRAGGGSVIVALGDDEAALQAILDTDPLVTDGFMVFTVHPFIPGLHDPAVDLTFV
ncbi:MAG: YCII-related protein [Subtercola sp.]|nr:YCII-related protein [Subtercola sp.]